MPHSLAQVYLHIIYSTKNRFPYLSSPEIRQETHAYLTGVCCNLGAPSLVVGGVDDHVHILCYMSRTLTIADLVAALKIESSKWLKKKDHSLIDFHWQTGYGAFSISPAHVDPLTTYIRDQEKHHRDEGFQDEYRRILDRYGVEYDERYIWD